MLKAWFRWLMQNNKGSYEYRHILSILVVVLFKEL